MTENMTTEKIVEWEMESEWRSEDEIDWLEDLETLTNRVRDLEDDVARVNDLAREVENKIREAVIRIARMEAQPGEKRRVYYG